MSPYDKEDKAYQYLFIATFVSLILLWLTSVVEDIEYIKRFFYTLALTLAGMTIVEGTKCTAKRKKVKETLAVAFVAIVISWLISCLIFEKIIVDMTIFMFCVLVQITHGFWVMK